MGDELTDAVIAGQIVAASADEDVLKGCAKDKLAALSCPYLASRSVDGTGWRVADPQTCSLLSETKDFWGEVLGVSPEDYV